MIVDVNVICADEEFLEEIDEIMEDTMVQIFILKSENQEQLNTVQECASNYNQIFYYAPLTLREEIDSNCLGYLINDIEELDSKIDKPLFIEDSNLTNDMLEKLAESEFKGIILNATKPYLELDNFFVSVGAVNFEKFQSDDIQKLSMDKIVLQSSYPKAGFEEIFPTVKKISDIIFRPDQSIIAEATKNTLILFGLRNN